MLIELAPVLLALALQAPAVTVTVTVDPAANLAARGVTAGCGNSNTRGQMAVFLVKSFGLS